MSMYCFGVDLGGTFIKFGLFDIEGNLIEKWDTPTVKETFFDDIAKNVLDKMSEKDIKKDDVKGVGVGVPGPVDGEGIVNGLVNLGLVGQVNIKNILEEKLGGIKCIVGNDANVAAMGEMLEGGGKGYTDMVMITLGTGVGGGVIIGGKMLSGVTGGAGEIGHFPVNVDEQATCGCGKRGCLEQYASATGIVRVAKERAMKIKMPTKILEMEELTAKDVFDLAKEGDMVAIDAVEIAARYLGIATAAIACTVNNKAFVVGGGVSRAGDFLLDKVKKYFNEYVFKPCSDVEFKLATLGNDAGIYGGAALVIKE
ncbi:MAG: ROK family glucokinase [Lachnospiraceae bacterium]|nr:ROK family glucokinase [Lachnospiraceae bacterium]